MKIAYILLSNGLEYDDRIRKEMFSIHDVLGNDVEFKIFAFSGDDNRAGSGVLSYGVPYEFVSVAHREGKKKDIVTMLRKEYSFYSQVAERVKNFDLLWVCDHAPFFFPLFSQKPIIWDLHEIPDDIIGTRLKNLLFHRMEKRSKWLIHANQERLDYLIRQGVVKRPMKNLIIRNFPDQSWLKEGERGNETFSKFKEWLGEDEYVYVQGVNGPGRFAWETLSAIMEAKRIKAVVVGKVPVEVKKKILTNYPEADKYLFFTGQVIQSETAIFIAKSKFSIVFYRASTPNNRYCEPNRMFQSLGMGKPVIVGFNEPMKNIVEKYGNGFALQSDGGDISENTNAINRMLDDYESYYSNANECKQVFSWESQAHTFNELFSK